MEKKDDPLPAKADMKKLREEQIKRLDKVAAFQQDPLGPFKKLLSQLDAAIIKSKKDKKDEVTIKLKDLMTVLPKRSDVATVALLLPAAYTAKFAEQGWNDGGDSDHNIADGALDTYDTRDPAGD